MDRNNTSYPKFNYERLKSSKWDPKSLMLYHQFIVTTHLISNPNQRGLLIFHGMGKGKTRLAASAAKLIHEHFDRVILIAPKSVHTQHITEFDTAGVPVDKVKSLSLRANNLVDQLAKLDFVQNMENTVLIVDEAHNFFNSIINGSENALALYDIIMNTKKIKILFLTGTPVVNDPFELIPCMNMLEGRQLFTENRDIFNTTFFDTDKNIKNADRFKARIFGLVSYYGDWIEPMKKSLMPKELPHKLLRLPMSEKQYSDYRNTRIKEESENKQEASRGAFQSVGRFASSSSRSSGSYRINSRKSSLLITPVNDKNIVNPEYSIKFAEVGKIVPKHKKQKGIIYSDFVNGVGGLAHIGRFLELKLGFKMWDPDMKDSTNGKTYSIISGGQTIDERKMIQDYYNHPKNIDGKRLRILLLGPAAAEGLDLMEGRFAIIMGPFFHYARMDQVKHRIIRFRSHERLPKSKRNVQVYTLVADYPTEVDEKKKPKEDTTDDFLWKLSLNKRIKSLKFYKLLIEASIDCGVHRDLLDKKTADKIDCFMCQPTDEQLFDPDFYEDIKSKSKCKPITFKKIKTKELIIETPDGDLKFMYNKNPDDSFSFFQFSDKLKGYIPVKRSSEHFAALYNKVAG